MEKMSKKRIAVGIGLLVGFVAILVLISVIVMNLREEKLKVIIDNVGKCSEGISERSKDVLFSNTYNLVKTQNDIEGVETKSNYHATLRENTCETEFHEGDDISNYTTSAIIDIEEAGYSFKIIYAWVKSNVSQDIDLGTVNAVCLDSNELLYGEFNCESNPMVLTKARLDPIIDVLPYFGDDYKMFYSEGDDVDSYKIVIEYDPPESVYREGGVQKFRSSRRQMAIDYLLSQGIDVDKYTIEETFAIN